MSSEYQYPDAKWHETEGVQAVTIDGTWLGSVIRFRDPQITHADIVITGQLGEVAHDNAGTTVLVYVTDTGDKQDYSLNHSTTVTRMVKA